MCKIDLSAEEYASSEQFLNTLILNRRRTSFDEKEILSIARKAGVDDQALVRSVLHNLGRRGLLVKIEGRYYPKSVVRHRVPHLTYRAKK